MQLLPMFLQKRLDRKNPMTILPMFMVSNHQLSTAMSQKRANQFTNSLKLGSKSLWVNRRLCASHGLPLCHHEIEQYVNSILEAQLGPNFKPFSSSWRCPFLAQWHDKLQSHLSKPFGHSELSLLTTPSCASTVTVTPSHGQSHTSQLVKNQ